MEPILTLAAFPQDLPKAPLIPACSLSAPAHDNILLILSTCQGCTLHLKWKLSLPTCLVRYLLQAIREASSASEEICSTSSETICTTKGKSATGAFFLPMSQILILGSGTPRLYLDLGQGFPLQTLQHLAGLLPILCEQQLFGQIIQIEYYAPLKNSSTHQISWNPDMKMTLPLLETHSQPTIRMFEPIG